ncbi:MAG: type II toxin-antitoxin system VapC family toxin [Thermoanaerobaculia bacterium]
MIVVLDASVALKWFVPGEPLRAEAMEVLDTIQENPSEVVVPELFFHEILAVLCRLPGSTAAAVVEAMTLLERLGIARVAAGHELLALAAEYAVSSKLSGYDATYVALAALTDGVWLTADERAARRVGRKGLVRLLGGR